MTVVAGHRLRIGVAASGDPSDPTTFSGSARSLMRGLTSCGVDVAPLSGRLPGPWERIALRATALPGLRPRDRTDLRRAVDRERMRGQLAEPVLRARERVIASAARDAGGLDGVVSIGALLRMPPRVPYVTLEDTTFPQARRVYPWFWLRGLRERDLDRLDRRAARVYGAARACCMMSHWATGSLHDDFAVPAQRVHVVGLGPSRPTTSRPRSWDTPRFLFVGYDWPRKNGPRVLDAFARLRASRPDATLDVVGGHPPLEAPGVTTHGVISVTDPLGERRLAELFARSTCFVMPSLHEPSAQVFIEAASAGLPSIGSTNGGSATVIGDGGVLVDPEDGDAILDAMLRLSDSETARAAGTRARRHAEQLTWELCAERVLRALRPEGLEIDRLASFL